MLSAILTVLLILNVLILLVLVTVFQHGNEGGIGSSLGGGNSSGFFGASGGVNIIVRATWVAGISFFVLSISLAWLKTNESFGVSKEIDSLLEESSAPAVSPAPEATPSSEVSPAPEALPTPAATEAEPTASPSTP
jgi:protein translocase SecG subunit